MIQIVGRTVDGKGVVSGVYRYYETHGLPLDVVLQNLHDRGMIPCWVSFHREASSAGMKHDRILDKLDPAVSDVFGSKFRDVVIRSLKRLHDLGKL